MSSTECIHVLTDRGSAHVTPRHACARLRPGHTRGGSDISTYTSPPPKGTWPQSCLLQPHRAPSDITLCRCRSAPRGGALPYATSDRPSEIGNWGSYGEVRSPRAEMLLRGGYLTLTHHPWSTWGPGNASRTFLVVRGGGGERDVEPLRQGVGVPHGELLAGLHVAQRPIEDLREGRRGTRSESRGGGAGSGERRAGCTCPPGRSATASRVCSWALRAARINPIHSKAELPASSTNSPLTIRTWNTASPPSLLPTRGGKSPKVPPEHPAARASSYPSGHRRCFIQRRRTSGTGPERALGMAEPGLALVCSCM